MNSSFPNGAPGPDPQGWYTTLAGIYSVSFMYLWLTVTHPDVTWIGLILLAALLAAVIAAIFFGAVKAVDVGWNLALYWLGFGAILSCAFFDYKDLPPMPRPAPPAAERSVKETDVIEAALSRRRKERTLCILICCVGAQMVRQAGHREGRLSMMPPEKPIEATLASEETASRREEV